MIELNLKLFKFTLDLKVTCKCDKHIKNAEELPSNFYDENNELEFTQKMRGFSNELNLKELLELNRDKDQIPTHIYKPLTLFQGLKYNNLDKTDINVFSDNIKILDINGDMRRLWCDSFLNADECLKRSINSVPIPI